MNIKRTILWAVLVISVFMLWSNWQDYHFRHSGEVPTSELAAENGKQNQNKLPQASLPQPDADPADAAVPDDPGRQASEKIKVSTKLLEVTFDTQGAQLVGAEIINRRTQDESEHDRITLLQQGNQSYTAQSGLLGGTGKGQAFPNQHTPFKLISDQTVLKDDGDMPVVFQAESNGIRLTRTYTFHQNSFRIDVQDKVENISDAALPVSIYYQITRDNHEPPSAAGFYKGFYGFSMYSDEGRFQKVSFKDIDKDHMDYVKQSSDGWISFIQHFFVTAWVPEQDKPHHVQIRKLSQNNLYAISATQSLGQLAAGQSTHANAVLWVGPQEQKALAQVDRTLPLVVDYGWLTIIAKPMFKLMTWLHSFIGNWGWSIIALTILIKIALYPLSAASYRSMAKMRHFAPRMKDLKEKYGDDRQGLNQAMMQLYRTERINPMGGCLPMLLQIPIFLTLYRVILASVELRGAPWIGWIDDLAVHDPYFILPIIMMGTMFLQFKLNPPPPDPTQAKIMMIMPLVFGAMMFMFPAGLVLYWTVNNILSIIQQKWIAYRLDKAAHDKAMTHR